MRAIRKGDLVLLVSTYGRGIVMVTNVRRRLFVGILIHTCPEMATDADVVLPQRTVAPYPVVLQFDLYGTFYRTQAARVLGHVPVDGCRFGMDPYAAPVAVAKHLDRLGASRGLPLQARYTARWTFKEEQLTEELQPLTRPFWSRFEW